MFKTEKMPSWVSMELAQTNATVGGRAGRAVAGSGLQAP